jgi:hypothetical protein
MVPVKRAGKASDYPKIKKIDTLLQALTTMLIFFIEPSIFIQLARRDVFGYNGATFGND